MESSARKISSPALPINGHREDERMRKITNMQTQTQIGIGIRKREKKYGENGKCLFSTRKKTNTHTLTNKQRSKLLNARCARYGRTQTRSRNGKRADVQQDRSFFMSTKSNES